MAEGVWLIARSQNPKDVTGDVAQDLSAPASELEALKGDAGYWLTGPGYVALRLRLEAAQAAIEAALAKAKRRARLNERREQQGPRKRPKDPE